jgi:nucleotide-binding universal stress UspA family protein
VEIKLSRNAKAMTPPGQIVVAMDLSPASTAAVRWAGTLAKIFNVKVTLLHVFEYVPDHRYPIDVGWMVETIRRDIRTQLEESENILRQSRIETEIVMLEDGIPAQQILGFLQGCQSPLLLMGTHAVAGMERFLLGSTAEQVLRRAKSPLITVGPHVVSKTEDHTGLRRIIFATDFSETSLGVVPFLLVLKQACGARLRVLHVSADRISEKEEDNQFAPVRNALQSGEDTEYITLHGTNISQAVVNEAERYPADLVALGVRQAPHPAAHFTAKIAFQIVAAAPCAVLSLAS